MRLFSRLNFSLIPCIALGLVVAVASARAEARYSSVQEARELGISAIGQGHYEQAIAPLEFAASRNDFLARFYLARVYADNGSTRIDHARAYVLYRGLADEFADVDPDDNKRVAFVARALTALAGYLRSGLSEIGLKPNAELAEEYLHHAATFFNDEDAQFQLAKNIIEESFQVPGQRRDRAREKIAVHWLSVLTKKRHAGAQALLAYLMWRGEHEPLVQKDAAQALALVVIAAENAQATDRMWIEDYYQEIYCGTSPAIRGRADSVTEAYRRQFGHSAETRIPERRERSTLGVLQPQADRTCASGEPLPSVRRVLLGPVQVTPGEGTPPSASMPAPFTHGTMAPPSRLGIIDAGSSLPAGAPRR